MPAQQSPYAAANSFHVDAAWIDTVGSQAVGPRMANAKAWDGVAWV